MIGAPGMRRRREKHVAAELHIGGLDERGRPISGSAAVELPRVLPWDRNSTETRDGKQVSHDRASMLIDHADMPAGVTIADTDRVRITAGRLAGWWNVDGRPADWPRGIEVALTRGRRDQ